MSPITKASGTKRVVLARHARNRRLADALYQQAFAALTASPGARDLLRHPSRQRRHPPPGPTCPEQPPRRDPARLPAAPPALRRDPRLATAQHQAREPA
jgi:hypothetical protein